MFSELHCLSHFTFLRGASSPQELVTQAHELDYRAIAITDECSFAGIVKAHVCAKTLGIQLIVGSEFRLDDDIHLKSCHLVLLASNRRAYSEISLLISKARRRSAKGHYQLSMADLQFGTQQCLAIWLPGLYTERHNAQATNLKNIFKQRLWLGVELHHEGDDRSYYEHCYRLAEQYDISMVACNDVHMHSAQRQALQDTLNAIANNTTIANLGRQRYRNGERYLRPTEKLQSIYPPALLTETLYIAEMCQFSLDELQHDYPQELVPKSLSASQHLRQLSVAGAHQRWPNGVPPATAKQLDYELSIIAELRYEHYFLTVEDIVRFARQQRILCQGRGSAANSVVCYCLFITEVNPDQSSLLFERFISKERDEPPDIDVDFEHERREEVIQYLYQKYSRKRAALAATIITYRPRSAIRDVGKVLGFDALLIERLANDLTGWDKPELLYSRLQDNGLQVDSHVAQQFVSLVQQILGTPRHLSQHVGGFLITQTPISNLVPVENAAMENRTIIQWDKEDIESMRLLKVDVLALGMLSAIRKTLALINQYYATPLRLDSIPKEDPRTYAMLCRGDSMGVFQVESRAQMAMLPRLKPRCFYDLVIQVAIVRPGPIQGDMVHPYLKRRSGEQAVSYPNDAVKAVLERTLGVPIFQEQVIKLAMVAAGFSGGEADQLRRAMASWGRNGQLNNFEQRLISGMLERGHSRDFAERLFRQMQGFGEYGFPESHAASFALLVYTSAWLKCHYPAAFYCGLLNSLPMGFYSASQLVQDAKRHHVVILPIDIAYSHWDHSLEHPNVTADQQVLHEPQPHLRLGMRLIKGFQKAAALRLLLCRQQHPHALSDLTQLAHRAKLSRSELESLAAANALGALSQHRHHGHWQVQAIEQHSALFSSASLKPNFAQTSDRTDPHASSHTYDTSNPLSEPSALETTLQDYRHTGLTLNQHPMSLLRPHPPFDRCLRASDLFTLNSGRFVRLAGIVTGRQRPGSASGVLFMTLEDETGNTNVIIWQHLQQRRRQAVLTSRIVMIKGVIECKDNVIHVIAGDIEDHSARLAELEHGSRDFH